jgi:hypothetical protein
MVAGMKSTAEIMRMSVKDLDPSQREKDQTARTGLLFALLELSVTSSFRCGVFRESVTNRQDTVVKESQGMGYGLYATKFIAKGSVIGGAFLNWSV